MGAALSRASKSGRSLAQASPSAEHAMRVRLSEKALKPEPRGVEELRQLSQAERNRIEELGAPTALSEYTLEDEEKDISLDNMLNDLGGSLKRHSVSLYDQKELAQTWARHKERHMQIDGRIEPKLLIEVFQQYYQEREASGESIAAAGIAEKYRLDKATLEKLFASTCLPAVRNDTGADERDAANVQMKAEWR